MRAALLSFVLASHISGETDVVPTPYAVATKMRGALYGALVADALCLGSHYEYDAQVIKKAYGGVISEYMAPGEKMGGTTHGVGWGRQNYHPGQKKGDLTDYGLYNLVGLEYFAKNPGQVDLNKLVPFWRKKIESKDWGAWKCTQSKQALQRVQSGTKDYSQLGGYSNAMAMRSAAVFGVLETEEEVTKAARLLMFTHASEEALSGGEFFTRVAWRIIHEGSSPREAIEATAKKMSKWIQQQVKKGIDKFEEAADSSRPLGREEFVDDLAMTSMARLWHGHGGVDGTQPIKVGKASPTEGTLPSSVYIILRYQDDFMAAAKANAMVGGDNASRAVAIGMVLGAYHGVGGIPDKFLDTLNARKKAKKLLKKLPLLKDAVSKDAGQEKQDNEEL